MFRKHNQILFSASDLTGFLSCPHLTSLELLNLETPLQRTPPDDQTVLIREKGEKHEQAYLYRLSRVGREVVNCKIADGTEQELASYTCEQIAAGKEILFQAYFLHRQFQGFSDFLIRVEKPSKLGDFSYEVIDTKLSQSEKVYFIVQLCLYSELLSDIQGRMPDKIHIVLGNNQRRSFALTDYFSYYQKVKELFLEATRSFSAQNIPTYPLPCTHCGMCHWRELCQEKLEKDDHLSLVANIRKDHIKKLEASGITTVRTLAESPNSLRIKKFSTSLLEKLQIQAQLQVKKRETGEDCYELLPPEREDRGFPLLPEPDPGDLFYDIEGDPLFESNLNTSNSPERHSGLEYLHGVYLRADFPDNSFQFKPFWALNKQEEKKSFEELMDFFNAHLEKHPFAHIYHYAPYEVSALKRLMSQWGTREQIVDDLLRRGKLIDLYKVVKGSLLVSEPKYSIKNLETFYMKKREQELKSGGASVVWFEQYLETKNEDLKNEIAEYNRIDCESTYLLRNWLLEKKKEAEQKFVTTFTPPVLPDEEDSKPVRSEKALEAEQLLEQYREKLTSHLPDNEQDYTARDHLSALVFYLTDFYRREQKPEFWEMFERLEKTPPELTDDPECLGELQLDVSSPPVPEKRSLIYTYKFPAQETKLKKGDAVKDPETNITYSDLYDLDTERYIAKLKISAKRDAPAALSLIPAGIVNHDVLRTALLRFVDSVIHRSILVSESLEINSSLPYSALLDILLQNIPRLKGTSDRQTLIKENSDSGKFGPALFEIVSSLDNSYLFIQGPPGTGKTYSGARLIVELLKSGKKVGVTSNSHKAIINMLQEVERSAMSQGVTFRGIKKSSGKDNPEDCIDGKFIRNVFKNEDIDISTSDLIAGTAWLFSREEFNQSLDYLFIDEAGQISLAMGVSVGTAAKNIILLGDQMQLAHPSKGIHPGRSGESVLEYLLEGAPTIPEAQGVFLNTTWRMHQDICEFLSEQIYENRLVSKEETGKQKILNANSSLTLPATGIEFIPVSHSGNSNGSLEEVDKIEELYQHYLDSKYVDKEGTEKAITEQDILIVAPYNIQVNLLKGRLGQNARVGTIDKFQGQEAQLVIVSMTTSSGDDLPRHMDFLFSKNRLNVALSRARSLAIIVACPELLKIKCETVAQMSLVNMLCAAELYAKTH